ncbi:hypothetical protein EV176_006855, partial [Coemansia sp. RSA 451]
MAIVAQAPHASEHASESTYAVRRRVKRCVVHVPLPFARASVGVASSNSVISENTDYVSKDVGIMNALCVADRTVATVTVTDADAEVAANQRRIWLPSDMIHAIADAV